MDENNVEYLTIPEAAQAVGRTIRTLHNWNKAGLVEFKKGIKYGRSRLVVAKSDIQLVVDPKMQRHWVLEKTICQ